MEIVMSRWWLVLTLMVVSVSARAQASQPTAATNGAEMVANAAEQEVARRAARRAELKQRYEDEVAEIDRLKKQRASWRRDRDLRDSLSASLETSKRLDTATREVDVAQRTLVNARRAYLTAIDAELKAGAPQPSRSQLLERAKLLLASQLRDVPHRILIPDLRIDPLADPEELLQHANELRASELELGRQIDELATQAIDLERAAQLRKQHERQGDLVNRYDDQPHRNSSRGDSSAEGPGVAGVSDPSSMPNVPPTAPSSFETYVPTVLADVIDASTINNFTAAQLSGDPAQRAQAARKAHDAVAQRSEEHTSELQSLAYLVCRLLLE